MQRILRKRLPRDFKSNAFRYLALGLMIVLCMYLIVSLTAAAETVIQGVDKAGEENRLENGEFTVFMPLTEDQKQELTDAGLSLESVFYMDFKAEKESTLRLFANRERMNLLALDEGHPAENDGEIVLEKRYAEEHGLKTGDTILAGGRRFQVTGTGSVPDYDAPYKELSDSSVDSKSFGIAFVTKRQYENLKEEGNSTHSESFTYAYTKNHDIADKEIKEILQGFALSPEQAEEFMGQHLDGDADNLIQFLPVEDNSRIKASADDQVVNKVAGLIAGMVILILFSYVISVFIIHSIEQESSVIGTLYAMGVKRKELILHYLTLPLVITAIFGLMGTLLGFSSFGLDVQMQDCYKYFSIPEFAPVYSPYLIIYGVLMPPVMVFFVNYIIMNRRLKRPVLALINKEQNEKNARNLELGNLGFVGRFRIRQMLREIRSTGTVIFGMFISLLILLLGINCYVMCMNISKQNKADTRYEYMYTYKYPSGKVPSGGEEAYAVKLTKENLGYQIDVTLLGIKDDNPYFDAEVKPGENKAVLSSAAAQKFGLKEGEQIVLTDKENDRDYTFEIREVIQYSPGMYVFMDIDSMRTLFGQEDSYFNVVFSDKALEISSEQLYGVSMKADVERSSDIFVNMMMPMIWMLSGVSVLVFAVVMYLMVKMMIDRSAFGISLMKVFGYRNKEVKNLYLNGNFYITAVGAAVCLPLSKMAMDAMYPVMVANLGCGMDMRYSWQLYLGIYAGILLLYFVISIFLSSRLKKILPAEILKNRE